MVWGWNPLGLDRSPGQSSAKFGVPQDRDAVAAIDALFPTRTAIGLPMLGVLAGGGGFHCASMQMPSAK